jgi:hypothetical protein
MQSIFESQTCGPLPGNRRESVLKFHKWIRGNILVRISFISILHLKTCHTANLPCVRCLVARSGGYPQPLDLVPLIRINAATDATEFFSQPIVFPPSLSRHCSVARSNDYRAPSAIFSCSFHRSRSRSPARYLLRCPTPFQSEKSSPRNRNLPRSCLANSGTRVRCQLPLGNAGTAGGPSPGHTRGMSNASRARCGCKQNNDCVRKCICNARKPREFNFKNTIQTIQDETSQSDRCHTCGVRCWPSGSDRLAPLLVATGQSA